MSKWNKPKSPTAAELAFNCPKSLKNYLPDRKEIPEEFNFGKNTKWNKIIARWFFQGLPKNTKFIPKKDIDINEALRHIKCVLGSFAPKHEHKESGLAYLMSLWFDDVLIPEPIITGFCEKCNRNLYDNQPCLICGETGEC